MVEEAMIDNFYTFYPLLTHFFKEHTILVEDEKRSTKREETDQIFKAETVGTYSIQGDVIAITI